MFKLNIAVDLNEDPNKRTYVWVWNRGQNDVVYLKSHEVQRFVDRTFHVVRT
jgi:hypothetical protein